jgi:exopolysaccharide production protein ExoQ
MTAVLGAPNAGPVDVRRRKICAAAAGLLICTNGPSVLVSVHVMGDPLNVDHWAWVLPIAAIGIASLLALARTPDLRAWIERASIAFGAVAGLLAMIVLSSVWSVMPTLTPVRSLLFAGVTLFGIWLGTALDRREQVLAICAATVIAGISSGLLVWLAPGIGLMPKGFEYWDFQYWRGLYSNRNSLGPVAGLGIIALVGLVAVAGARRRLAVVVALPLLALHVRLIQGAQSDTVLVALVAFGLGWLLMPFFRLCKHRRVPGWGAALALIALGSTAWVVTFANFDRIAGWFGKDPTWSLRRPIWADMRQLIAAHPVRGYGFWAFWDRPDLVAPTYANVGVPYGSAHNSVLEMALGVGWIGAGLFVIILLCAAVRAARSLWRSPSHATAWWLGVLAFLIVENLTESFVLWYSYMWVLLVAGAVMTFPGAADPLLPTPGQRDTTARTASVLPGLVERPSARPAPVMVPGGDDGPRL